MKRITFICERCQKQVDLSIYDYNKNNIKYSGNFCRGCRQHFQYESGIRDKNLLKNSIKPQKGVSMKERCNMTDEEYQSYKKNLSNMFCGEKNPMYGEHTHTKGLIEHNKYRRGKTWDEVYGKELSDKMKKQMSERQLGEKNCMFGKPSPTGSGNGWSGWYKDMYFRSLLELSFIVKNPDVKNAENIKIPYKDWDNKDRTYHPDFILENTIFEVKPKHLLNSKTNQLKFEAAKLYCMKNQLIYKIITEEDIEKLSDEDIKSLHNQGVIKFIDRYEEKYRRRPQ